jgi:hypothetical protein
VGAPGSRPGSYEARINPTKIPGDVSDPPVSTEPSPVFIIVLFAGAIAIGAAITYLGIIGALGGPIP